MMFYEKAVGITPSRRASIFISSTYVRFFMEIMVCGNLFQVSKIWQKSHIFFYTRILYCFYGKVVSEKLEKSLGVLVGS